MLKSTILPAVCGLSLCGAAVAAIAPAMHDSSPRTVAPDDTLHGRIASIDALNKTFGVKVGENDETRITYNDKTIYTLNGKESTMDKAIKVGHTVVVTHKDKIASRVDATSAPGL
jgi:hypothetical protein